MYYIIKAQISPILHYPWLRWWILTIKAYLLSYDLNCHTSTIKCEFAKRFQSGPICLTYWTRMRFALWPSFLWIANCEIQWLLGCHWQVHGVQQIAKCFFSEVGTLTFWWKKKEKKRKKLKFIILSKLASRDASKLVRFLAKN